MFKSLGNVPWCPQITKAIAQILYWKGIQKRTRGGHIGAHYLQCMANHRGLCQQIEHLQHADNKMQQAYKHYL